MGKHLTPLDVNGTTIHNQSREMYSLNDLWEASGGSNRHRPSHWLKLKHPKEVIKELENENPNAGIPAIKPVQIIAGKYGGRSESYALLTETQAYFLLMLSRNLSPEGGAMKSIALTREGTSFLADSRMLSDRLKIAHHQVYRTILKYEADIRDLEDGRILRFESEKIISGRDARALRRRR
ncbi:MAG: KilA-N domain-containing protein [Pseudomonadota bacterium]|nr:KilA-N domain-containing protein [Pseudomonadota bacterium]